MSFFNRFMQGILEGIQEGLEDATDPEGKAIREWQREEKERIKREIKIEAEMNEFIAKERAKYKTNKVFESSKDDEYYSIKGKIVELVHTIEIYLKNANAVGESVNDLLYSVQGSLPQSVFNAVKKCNHLRNKMVHQSYIPLHSELEEFKLNLVQIRYHFDPLEKLKETAIISDILKGQK